MIQIKEYKTTVYVSHPSKNLPENTDRIAEIIKKLHSLYPDVLFVSPVHSFGFMYDEVSYNDGLDMCLWLLNKTDEMWVFGDWHNSVGCCCEVAYCQNNGIPWKIFTDNECCKKIKDADCTYGCVLWDDDDGGSYCELRNVAEEFTEECKND